MPSVLFTVTIEIKPYLKKWLLAKSENKKFPLKFPRKHDYNILLLNLVTNYNSLSSIPLQDRENVLEYFRPSCQQDPGPGVTIILPFNSRKDIRSYNYLSVASKKTFRREVRMDFNFEFNRFLIENLRKKKRRLDIVNEFKEKYDISEDDLKTESLYRYSSRLLEDL